MGLQNRPGNSRVKCRNSSIVLMILLSLASSCGNSDGLHPPVSVTSSTVGKICENIRDTFPDSPMAKVIAIGSCEEQKTITGGRSLWIELSDFTKVNPNLSASSLKLVMVDVAVSISAFGFRISQESPSDFEQLFFSFADDRGSYFEINPLDLQKVLPGEELPQAEWDKLVEREVLALVPRITISTSK